MRPMFDPSPEILKNNQLTPKFPWKDLLPGKSWSIQYSEVTLGTLKSMASRYGKKLGRKFKVRDHGPQKGYEVLCKALTETEAINTSQNIVEVLDKTGGVVAGAGMTLMEALEKQKQENGE